MTSEPPVIVAPFGDAALLLTFGDRVDRAIARRVHRAASCLERAAIGGVTDIVPAYATLAVYYDHAVVAYEAIRQRVLSVAETGDAEPERRGREIIIPVRYDGEDLPWIAEQAGLRVEDVIERHSRVTYYAYMLGFVPGFAYLGELDPSLVVPRRAFPRQRVRAGSVAIAGAQTAVYPLDTPGGWHIVGSTALVLFDPARSPASLIHAGDLVRFEPHQ